MLEVDLCHDADDKSELMMQGSNALQGADVSSLLLLEHRWYQIVFTCQECIQLHHARQSMMLLGTKHD